MLQVLLNVLTFDMDVQDAVEAPRFISHSFPSSFEPHASHPGKLAVESRIEGPVRETLTARGHRVETVAPLSPGAAAVCLIKADLRAGTLWGGADPRRSTRAMGW
jgi:gamma-glutamyltranspeptidase/glutathione hydrolase